MLVKYHFPQLKVFFEIPDLYCIVYKALLRIPSGKITTYGEIARALGDIRASRGIGQILALNPWPDKYPCYKVVRSDGTLGNYSYGGLPEKIKRLAAEGIDMSRGKILNFQDVLVDHRSLGLLPYLASLRRIQETLKQHITLLPVDSESIRYILTLDTAYLSESFPEKSISVGVLYDLEKEKILRISLSLMPIFFPYIPGYLFFREGPPLLSTIENVLSTFSKIDVAILDGHGLLHPRKAGIATHMGILLSMPTIGVAKKLLYGKVIEASEKRVSPTITVTPIKINDNIAGYRLRKGKSSIYVSPGNLIDPESALKIILRLKWTRYKVPDLLYLPHFIASRLRKRLTDLFRSQNKQV
ncbi:MAG: endonuclease V [Candidatus Njordarchaeales archaeon]